MEKLYPCQPYNGRPRSSERRLKITDRGGAGRRCCQKQRSNSVRDCSVFHPRWWGAPSRRSTFLKGALPFKPGVGLLNRSGRRAQSAPRRTSLPCGRVGSGSNATQQQKKMPRAQARGTSDEETSRGGRTRLGPLAQLRRRANSSVSKSCLPGYVEPPVSHRAAR